jgi:hypothetical protein
MRFDEFVSFGIPEHWSIGPAPSGGGQVLVGEAGAVSHLIAPPGAGAHVHERTSARAGWRHAVWCADRDGEPKAIDVDPPDSIQWLATRAVINQLPEELHEFVRCEMARQIGWTVAFGHRESGAPRVEADARRGAQAENWLRDELEMAFPRERWYARRTKVAVFEVPDTADELLDLLPAVRPFAKERPRACLCQSFGDEWPFDSVLPSKLASGTLLSCDRSSTAEGRDEGS